MCLSILQIRSVQHHSSQAVPEGTAGEALGPGPGLASWGLLRYCTGTRAAECSDGTAAAAAPGVQSSRVSEEQIHYATLDFHPLASSGHPHQPQHLDAGIQEGHWIGNRPDLIPNPPPYSPSELH